ncbi:MAG: MarR family winged helix-turn-helix transcriptional regulator [Cellulosilyticaceae bacterium]
MSTSNLPELSEQLFGLVVKLNSTIFKHDEFFKLMPLPPSHVKVIFYLMHHKASTMSDIAEKLCISRPNMTPIIDKLIHEGLVVRLENPSDRRMILIDTTDKAHSLFEEHKRLIKERLVSRIEPLTSEDLNQLEQSMALVTPILDKINNSI